MFRYLFELLVVALHLGDSQRDVVGDFPFVKGRHPVVAVFQGFETGLVRRISADDTPHGFRNRQPLTHSPQRSTRHWGRIPTGRCLTGKKAVLMGWPLTSTAPGRPPIFWPQQVPSNILGLTILPPSTRIRPPIGRMYFFASKQHFYGLIRFPGCLKPDPRMSLPDTTILCLHLSERLSLSP
jgi:hypothetical protein